MGLAPGSDARRVFSRSPTAVRTRSAPVQVVTDRSVFTPLRRAGPAGPAAEHGEAEPVRRPGEPGGGRRRHGLLVTGHPARHRHPAVAGRRRPLPAVADPVVDGAGRCCYRKPPAPAARPWSWRPRHAVLGGRSRSSPGRRTVLVGTRRAVGTDTVDLVAPTDRASLTDAQTLRPLRPAPRRSTVAGAVPGPARACGGGAADRACPQRPGAGGPPGLP